MKSPETDSLINSMLQSYYILESLGSGAVADVYKAVHVTTHQTYAVKVMQSRWMPFPHVVPRFQAEAQLLFDLQHPHIVTAYPPLGYLETDQGQPYFAMEYLAGGSLSEHLRHGGELTLGQATEMMTSICSALHYAHRQGVIHRDLKPANILLRDPNVPQSAVLTDFGIAKMLYQTQMTNLNNQPGTPEYMSPEQFQTQEATAQSDQYAMGIILYWLLTRQLPFRANDLPTIAMQHINVIPPPPSQFNPEIPQALDRVVMQAMSKDPSHRFRDIRQLAYAFSQAVYGSHVEQFPLNAVHGARPPTNQGYARSTGVARDPGPSNIHGAGPGVTPSQIERSNPLGTFPPPRRLNTAYLVVGVLSLVTVLLLGIFAVLFSMDEPIEPTPTAVSLISTETLTSTPKTPTQTSQPEATSTPRQIHTPGSPIIVSTAVVPSATSTHTLTATDTDTPTLTHTPTATATTVVPTATQITFTPTPVPTLEDMLNTLYNELGSSLNFNCQRFVETYNALRNELDGSNPAYERARVLFDEPDDYAVQIYNEYCRNNASASQIRIDSRLFSNLRTDTRDLMGN